MDFRRTYRSAAVAYVDLVSRVPAGRWDAPGLGDWTVRELVGHTVSSALRQVPTVLETAAEEIAVPSPEGYWALARQVPAEVYAAAVAASGDDAHATGLALADDPADAVREMAGRATQAVAAAGDDDVVTTAAGGMRVRDWLPTRTFELVVHGMDLAAAAGVPHGMAPEAVAEAMALAARTAIAVGDAEALLRALTGRGELPPKFSVV
ncbi:maleylpyruvate isomerase N-terminal domain-containing protein [Actinoplanes sp. NPDC026619]|uniref:maleylpyruvate isomerase N-terminal domain-containing protein n=1 Tax=Actinoplanes sp. NPDC026619 TaxID=3155798 RepID=UPI0033E3B3AA